MSGFNREKEKGIDFREQLLHWVLLKEIIGFE